MNIREKLANQLEPSNIEGLSIEMKDFFSSESSINSFQLEYSTYTQSYTISCTKHSLTPDGVKDFFMRFVRFIQYSSFTFYTKTRTEEKIEFELISGSEDMICFCCNVIFLQNQDTCALR